MKKKTILSILALLLIGGAFVGWKIFGPTVSAPEKKYFYVRTGDTYETVKSNLVDAKIIGGTFWFNQTANKLNYSKAIKAGRYEIKSGMSIFNLVRMLRSGNQAPVNLIITKLRTKEDLAQKIAANFECDSSDIIHFLNSNDSLAAFNLDSNTVMTAVVPNTYSLLWNTSFPKIFRRLYTEQQKFWNEERRKKATAEGFTPQQIYTLASIVEEETNKQEDKGKIASVYINRINKGMRLGADPTVKFALKDFGLRRIYEKHLRVQSPYNTYINSGLPPGPICTPSAKTIDAVLDAPATNFIYFVAKPELNGYFNFAATYEEHLRYAKAYQQALDTLMMKRSGAIN